jgi:GntR family transcriptional regulator/MocR family aminotransferase
VLTDFINEGHLSRHIRRARLLYRERRERLVECLGSEFGSRLHLIGGKTGLHLVAALPANKRDRELSMLAMEQRLWLWPLSHCYLGRGGRHGFILGFGSVATEDIAAAVHRLKGVLLAAGV